ncbi:Tetratricopeptide, MLP1/MLP2-like protein [Artemisia annua]|uniref:Tetratricopeptide, MLP1/MLP2-like protein n=1 Tax=Artemisia annua TaxID=35608 RepID=A0A2U1PSF3_ARTAN|nr:Tetratricopeptide, MLP1/MLP2-like protein [Artemisia annua]
MNKPIETKVSEAPPKDTWMKHEQSQPATGEAKSEPEDGEMVSDSIISQEDSGHEMGESQMVEHQIRLSSPMPVEDEMHKTLSEIRMSVPHFGFMAKEAAIDGIPTATTTTAIVVHPVADKPSITSSMAETGAGNQDGSDVSIVYTSGPTEVKPEEPVAYTVSTTINLNERAKLRSWQRLARNQPSPPVRRWTPRRGAPTLALRLLLKCLAMFLAIHLFKLCFLYGLCIDHTALQTAVIICNKQTAGVHIGVGVYNATSHCFHIKIGNLEGMLEDGQELAVKRLSKTSSQGINEFMNEVICIEGYEKLLIYEYMPNSSSSINYILFFFFTATTPQIAAPFEQDKRRCRSQPEFRKLKSAGESIVMVGRELGSNAHNEGVYSSKHTLSGALDGSACILRSTFFSNFQFLVQRHNATMAQAIRKKPDLILMECKPKFKKLVDDLSTTLLDEVWNAARELSLAGNITVYPSFMLLLSSLGIGAMAIFSLWQKKLSRNSKDVTEGEGLHKDYKSPFLISGCKVVDVYGTMLHIAMLDQITSTYLVVEVILYLPCNQYVDGWVKGVFSYVLLRRDLSLGSKTAVTPRLLDTTIPPKYGDNNLGVQKMNTAEMFQAAFKYIKFSETQIGVLRHMALLPVIIHACNTFSYTKHIDISCTFSI